MGFIIYHNPRCSKSRKTLELLRSAGIEPSIVEYLREPPDSATILDVAERLELPVKALLRRGEDAFKQASDLPALDEDEALAGWIADHPITLERPIVVDSDSGRVIIGRPPENVTELLS